MKLVETAQEEAQQRIVLCDLNWTRLVKFVTRSRNFSITPPPIIISRKWKK